MQPAITLASGSTTDPFFVQPDGWVIIEAGSASATLQYTTGTPADISNGTATWVTAGSYTGFIAIRADEELADTWVKLTAASGSITYHVEGELSKTDRLTIRGYKKTSINSVAPSYALDSSGNVTGLVGPGGGVVLNITSARKYGVTLDGRLITGVSATSSSAIVSSSTYQFLSSDVGKLISIPGAGTAGAVLNAVIQSVSAGSATLSVAAGTSIAGSGTATFGTDDTAAWNAAAADASTYAMEIDFPSGISIISGSINWGSNASMRGKGAGKSVLKWISTGSMESSVIYSESGSYSAPLTDCRFYDFEIDASSATQTTYSVRGKGIFILYMKRPVFKGLYIHDTPATGLGADFMEGAVIDGNYISNCGRLNTGGSLGGAGIGIGVSLSQAPDFLESYTVVNNFIKSPGTFGIFFEYQGAGVTTAVGLAKCNNNTIELTRSTSIAAIGDCGMRRFECVGNHIYSSTSNADGIVAKATALAGPGCHGVIAGNNIVLTNNGISIDYTTQTQAGQKCAYTIRDNRIQACTNIGIKLTANSVTSLDTVSITNNFIISCGSSGVATVGTAGVNDLQIVGNTILSNGTTGGSATQKSAVAFNSGVVKLRVIGNTFGDNSTGSQTYGIALAASVAITDAFISNNDISKNATGAINLGAGATIAGWIIGNKGYNPVGASAATVGASPWTYTAGNTPENLHVFGGTVSAIAKAGTTIANSTGTTVSLQPGESVTVTYSAAPTAVADKR